jgi:hypothetical protein
VMVQRDRRRKNKTRSGSSLSPIGAPHIKIAT